jgi:dolichyl-phosphate beta-glucosyltransferase
MHAGIDVGGRESSFSLVTIIVPAYNEVRSIGQTIQEIRAYFDGKPYDHEIVVAADGTDGTRELVAGFGDERSVLRVIGSPERRGKGRGIREAVAIARGDVIGFVDADNKTPISEFDRFEPHFRAGSDVVIGSRGMAESRIERSQPWYRRIGSRGFGLFMHASVGLPDIVDTQCGFKFFRGAVARDLFRRQRIDGYMFDVEILFLASRRGYRIAQVPVRWRDDGDSRLNLLAGNLRNLVDVLQIRFRCHDLSPTPHGASLADTRPSSSKEPGGDSR